ncbi:MAG TPA: LCP family protein [Thermoanaerobaculia bacterium]|nr:LCP family protein [Thermoanaerobaculia bacterium]
MSSAQSGGPRYTRYRRWNRDGSGRFGRSAARDVPAPTRSQSAVEFALFGVFGLLLIVAAVAIYTSYSPDHKKVPNLVDAGMKEDRVNVLVIGIGGDAHPGGGKDLADSIVLVSLKPSTRQVAVMSIPRDLWVGIGRYGTHRLNRAHEIGNQTAYPGAGPGLMCDTVSDIFAIPIHGFVRVDFAAFEKMIDSLGGVDVYVPHTFYDYMFRDGFAAGWHRFNGARALAYARYRYIIGPEGDNFARELRQQQVIDAIRDKLRVVSPQQALRVANALRDLSSHTDTNLTPSQMASLFMRFRDVEPASVEHVSLKPLTEIFMVRRLTDPGEAVRPKTKGFHDFQVLARDIFRGQEHLRANRIRFAATPAKPRSLRPSPSVLQ